MGSNRKGSRPRYNTDQSITKQTEKNAENWPKELGNDACDFYGLTLDEDQINLRNKIWDPDIDAVFVDSPAGTGKSLVSIATAHLMREYGRYTDMVYVMHPVGDPQGALPGTITEKSSVYFESLYQALTLATNDWPAKYIKQSSMGDTDDKYYTKQGSAYITAITDTYLRGSNIGSKTSPTILIIDEAQNFPEFALRKVLTRACEGTKVVVIGHTLQCDLKGEKSGFARCQEHFRRKNDPRFAFCELHNCHRSIVAQVADEPWNDEELDKEDKKNKKGE